MKNFLHKDQPPVVIRYGKFIQTNISLLIVVLALFCFITGLSKLKNLTNRQKYNEETILLEKNEENLQNEIKQSKKI